MFGATIMSEPMPSILETRRDQVFPTLTPDEIERLRGFGDVRRYANGERIFRVGEVAAGLTLVLAGAIDVVQTDVSGHQAPIVTHHPGSFMGELAQLAGRPSLVDAYA